MRRWIVGFLAAGLVVSLAAPAAADRPGKVELKSERAAAVTIGDTAWLAFTWKARGDLQDFRVVVEKTDGAEVSYPENTGTYSGPYQSPDLMDGEIDFTAIKVHVPSTEKVRGNSGIKLRLEASWRDGDRRRSSHHYVKIPVAAYEGADAAQVTDLVEVPAGDGAWVEVAYAGMAPLLDRFSVVVEADPALAITYPGYGANTSLHHDATLEDGETDVVRFFVDSSNASEGEYKIAVFASYARGDRPGGLEGVVTVSVIP